MAINHADSATQDQLKLLESQLNEMAKQSASADRSSTISRAWLFVNYDTPQGPEQNINERSITIHFSIKNAGQTPAILTAIQSHLFVRPERFYTPDNPPDPEAKESAQYHEKYKTGYIQRRGNFIYNEDFGGRISISAGSFVDEIEVTYLFDRELSNLAAHGAWFYCKLNYKDIFGIERSTRYYVGLYGAASSYPTSRTIADKYDSWD